MDMIINSEELAKQIRILAVKMTSRSGGSHVGSMLSMADIIAVLYTEILKKDPEHPRWDQRDRFILSKGHAGAALYAALAFSGYFAPDKLENYCADGSHFCGHATHGIIPGVEFSTGSLGHGLPVATGMAFSAMLDNKQHKCFALLSDGECDEGPTWEAVLFAGHHKLNNLVVIVDYNKMQALGNTAEVLNLEPFADKWRSFNWQVIEIDGHDHKQISRALDKENTNFEQPKCVIAHTLKGKGVSFMEGNLLWHYRSPQKEELTMALAELGGN